jgi:signal transduction histidine kinase
VPQQQGHHRASRSRLLNPIVWISLAQVTWVIVLVGWIIYVVDRNERLAEFAAVVRTEGFGKTAEWSSLVWGLVLLVVLFVAMVFITVGVARAWSENRAIHRFVSTVSHELRTPLASIRLYLETMQAHHDLSSDERQEFLVTMLADVDRLSESIDAILAASRLERRGITLELVSIDLADFLRSYLTDRANAVALRGRTLVLGDVEELNAMSNHDALTTVLNNLVDNSVRYSHVGSTIEISLCIEWGQARFDVVDQGHGIAKRELKYLFRMFYRGGVKFVAKGTGLGLYIVKGLVSAMGGRVVIKSEGLNHGTTVSVFLPLQKRA